MNNKRLVIVLSFLFFMVLFSPVWWNTTGAKRTRIDHEHMASIAPLPETTSPADPQKKQPFKLRKHRMNLSLFVAPTDDSHLIRQFWEDGILRKLNTEILLAQPSPLNITSGASHQSALRWLCHLMRLNGYFDDDNFMESQVVFLFDDDAAVVGLSADSLSSGSNNTDANRGNDVAKLDEIIRKIVREEEWKLDSPAFLDSTFHYILYVLPQTSDASRIVKSFVIPNWGSVVFVTWPAAQHRDHSVENQIVGTFINHFLTLHDFPTLDSGFQEHPSLGTEFLLRSYRELYNSTRSSLQTLSRLLLRMPNIYITEAISSLIRESLDLLSQSRQHLQSSNPELAYMLVAKAFRSAESAFFDESMLSLLYFPEEHKMAIYLPLVLPVSVTIMLGFVKELRTIRQKKRSRPTTTAAATK